MSAGPRAILFDALGTLLRLEPPAPLLRRELKGRLGVEVSEAQAAEALAQEIAYYRAHLHEGNDEAALASLRARCAEVLRSALPKVAELRAASAQQLQEVLLSSLHFTAYEDAVATLPVLSDRGRRLVVASNWDVSLHGVLERVGLASHLTGIVTSAEVGTRKPAPLVFERALSLAGAAAFESLHVGDSEVEDVLGARNAGVEPILLSRSGAEGPEGVRTIRTLAELI